MSIKATWNKVTTRTSGRPVEPGEVAFYELEMRVEGSPDFTVIGQIEAVEATEYTVDVSDPGLYEFRVRAFDDTNAPGAYAIGSVTIADKSPLSAPTNFTVQLV